MHQLVHHEFLMLCASFSSPLSEGSVFSQSHLFLLPTLHTLLPPSTTHSTTPPSTIHTPPSTLPPPPAPPGSSAWNTSPLASCAWNHRLQQAMPGTLNFSKPRTASCAWNPSFPSAWHAEEEWNHYGKYTISNSSSMLHLMHRRFRWCMNFAYPPRGMV